MAARYNRHREAVVANWPPMAFVIVMCVWGAVSENAIPWQAWAVLSVTGFYVIGIWCEVVSALNKD